MSLIRSYGGVKFGARCALSRGREGKSLVLQCRVGFLELFDLDESIHWQLVEKLAGFGRRPPDLESFDGLRFADSDVLLKWR